jgi:hypothetical protein
MKKTKEVRLLFQGRVIKTVAGNTRFGKQDFRNVHNDANYLSDPQFYFYLARDGQIYIEHIAGANNETLIDSKPLKQAMAITNGMTITVGNLKSGIKKFPLLIEISNTGSIKNNILINRIFPGNFRLIKSTGNQVGNIIKKISASTITLINSIGQSTGNILNKINYSVIGSKVAIVLSALASGLGFFLLAMLRGMARGGTGLSGSGGTRIHRGNSIYNEVILTINGTNVHEGNSIYSQVIMTINGNQIHRGSSMFGEVIVSVNGQSVNEGSSMFGTTIATINGDTVCEGTSMFGNTIAKIEGGGNMAGAAAAAFLLRM